MSTNELRAAAMEVVATKSIPPIEDSYGLPNVQVPTQAWLSAMAVGCAYLAENPADSETPVSEAWLRSVGFAPWSDGTHGLPYVLCGQPALLDIETDFSVMWVNHLGTPDEQWNVIPTIVSTRGDVRRLCVALKIKLSDEP